MGSVYAQKSGYIQPLVVNTHIKKVKHMLVNVRENLNLLRIAIDWGLLILFQTIKV